MQTHNCRGKFLILVRDDQISILTTKVSCWHQVLMALQLAKYPQIGRIINWYCPTSLWSRTEIAIGLWSSLKRESVLILAQSWCSMHKTYKSLLQCIYWFSVIFATFFRTTNFAQFGKPTSKSWLSDGQPV